MAAVHELVKSGDLEGLKAHLAAHPQDLHLEDQACAGYTPLDYALQGSQAELLEHLLERGCACAGGRPPEMHDLLHWSDDMAAALARHCALEGNHSFFRGGALFTAVWFESLLAVKILMERGANPCAPGEHGLSSLETAKWKGAFGCVLEFSCPAKEQKDAFFEAVRSHGRLRPPTALDEPLFLGATALHWACFLGDLPLVEDLLRKGADPDPFCWGGIEGVRLGWHPVVKPPRRRGRGFTPLHLAAKRACLPVAESLLAAGAEPLAADPWQGWTPLDYAKQSRSRRAVRMLVEATRLKFFQTEKVKV